MQLLVAQPNTILHICDQDASKHGASELTDRELSRSLNIISVSKRSDSLWGVECTARAAGRRNLKPFGALQLLTRSSIRQLILDRIFPTPQN